MRLAIAQPVTGTRELAAVTRAVRGGWIARGPEIEAFERAFAIWLGGAYAASRYAASCHAVSVASGTAAVEVSVRAAGFMGAEIVTGAISCQATANALLAAGCSIRFADHDPETWQISARSVERAITKKTAAILVAHLFGAPADMDALRRVARRRGIPIIEDCCQSMGAAWRGRKIGRFGVSSSFSFYTNKLITTGEGGMAVFGNRTHAARAERIRNHGQDGPFHHVEFGLNWKMPNLLCALGLAQLLRADSFAAARRKRADLLRTMLGGHPSLCLPIIPKEAVIAPFCMPIVLRRGDALKLRGRLERQGIETRPIFPPQCDQPYWSAVANSSKSRVPVSRDIARRGLYLATGPHLTIAQIRRIGRAVLDEL